MTSALVQTSYTENTSSWPLDKFRSCIAISSLLVGHHKHCHWLVSCWWSARTLLTDGGHGDWVESSHTWDLRFVSYRPAPYSPQFDTPLILWAITAIILCKRKPRVDHTNGFGNFIFASDKVAQWKLLHFSPHYDGKERYLLDIWSQVSYYLKPATLNANTIYNLMKMFLLDFWFCLFQLSRILKVSNENIQCLL